MTEKNLDKILSDALALQAENEIVEFKEAKSSYGFSEIGEYFSALSNEANLKGKPYAWLIFGVNDNHKIVGTKYRPDRKGLDSLKKELAERVTNKISFIEIYELQKSEGRVIMFQIPAAPKGIPIEFNGFFYGRTNESLVGLSIEKIDRIRNQAQNKDWSKNIVPDATFDHLDKKAILKAREKYKQKHPNLANEVDNWDDRLFLDKAKITLNGKITNTAILLLGKDEAGAMISPAVAKMSWVLKTAVEDYEHFHTPFMLAVDKALACIRNLKYRYMVDDTTLFPEEVKRYDEWVIREALHNAIAHQDYSKSCRIIILEYNDKLIFENAGNFIPESVEEAIHHNRPQQYYRNPFLIDAMVNLNMIDTVGSGIKKMFTIQRERYFPMPTYNISNEKNTEVIIHGELINENYSRLLKKHPELLLDDVISLDRAQKKLPIKEDEIQRLRGLKLIKGRGMSLEIIGSSNSLTNKDYKQMILDLIEGKKSISREDVEKILVPVFPKDWTATQQRKKISNLLADLSRRKKIKNVSKSDKYPTYEIEKV